MWCIGKMEDSQRDKKLELIKNQVKILMDSFDSVQVFCTKFEGKPDDNTSHYAFGNGNWFTRYGQIKEWTILEEKKFGEKND